VSEQLVEPDPAPERRDRNPAAYEQITPQPGFLFFRLRADK
jgi:hypothetical protein